MNDKFLNNLLENLREILRQRDTMRVLDKVIEEAKYRENSLLLEMGIGQGMTINFGEISFNKTIAYCCNNDWEFERQYYEHQKAVGRFFEKRKLNFFEKIINKIFKMELEYVNDL